MTVKPMAHVEQDGGDERQEREGGVGAETGLQRNGDHSSTTSPSAYVMSSPRRKA